MNRSDVRHFEDEIKELTRVTTMWSLTSYVLLVSAILIFGAGTVQLVASRENLGWWPLIGLAALVAGTIASVRCQLLSARLIARTNEMNGLIISTMTRP